MARTVLVADDSPTIQNRAKGILTGEGLEVVTVSNGVAAIKKLPTIKPVLVFADVAMPGKDGYEVCDFIKNHPELQHVPVVLIFSDADPYSEQQGARVRADGTIKKMVAGKPLDPDELISTAAKFLARAEAAAPEKLKDTLVTAPKSEPAVVTEPVDAEPQAPAKKGFDLASMPQEVAFAAPTPEEPAPPPPPPPPAEPMTQAEFVSEPAMTAEAPPAPAEPVLTEEATSAPEAAPTAAPERTLLFRVPSEIAEPVLSDELAPSAPPVEPPPPVETSENSTVAATTLESYSLSEAATGQVRFASPLTEATPEAESVTAQPEPAVEAEVPAAAPAPAIDRDLIYTIVHKAVAKMSPRALSSSVVDEMAATLADEIAAELSSESSQSL